jgi:hypothetical protein
MASLIVFIDGLSFSASPKSQRIGASHEENILEHLEHGEGTDGAATNFRPFNFSVRALQFCLHCQE